MEQESTQNISNILLILLQSKMSNVLLLVYYKQLDVFLVLQPINKSCDQMPLSIIYSPISVGKLRFWTHMLHSIETLHQFGKGIYHILFLIPARFSCIYMYQCNETLYYIYCERSYCFLGNYKLSLVSQVFKDFTPYKWCI